MASNVNQSIAQCPAQFTCPKLSFEQQLYCAAEKPTYRPSNSTAGLQQCPIVFTPNPPKDFFYVLGDLMSKGCIYGGRCCSSSVSFVGKNISHLGNYLFGATKETCPFLPSSYNISNFKAAGTLIYSINPEDGKAYVLLTKEAPNGPRAGRWTGFGGWREYGEHLIETALRETKEETKGTVDFSVDCIDFNRLVAVEHHHCKYLQLLLPIEYDPTIPDRFLQARMTDPSSLEKVELRWVLASNLMRAVRHVDAIARKTLRDPREVDVSIQTRRASLLLGREFAETMTILNREAPQVMNTLGHQISETSLTVSDKKWHYRT